MHHSCEGEYSENSVGEDASVPGYVKNSKSILLALHLKPRVLKQNQWRNRTRTLDAPQLKPQATGASWRNRGDIASVRSTLQHIGVGDAALRLLDYRSQLKTQDQITSLDLARKDSSHQWMCWIILLSLQKLCQNDGFLWMFSFFCETWKVHHATSNQETMTGTGLGDLEVIFSCRPKWVYRKGWFPWRKPIGWLVGSSQCLHCIECSPLFSIFVFTFFCFWIRSGLPSFHLPGPFWDTFLAFSAWLDTSYPEQWKQM